MSRYSNGRSSYGSRGYGKPRNSSKSSFPAGQAIKILMALFAIGSYCGHKNSAEAGLVPIPQAGETVPFTKLKASGMEKIDLSPGETVEIKIGESGAYILPCDKEENTAELLLPNDAKVGVDVTAQNPGKVTVTKNGEFRNGKVKMECNQSKGNLGLLVESI
jgi:hypothetical protein